MNMIHSFVVMDGSYPRGMEFFDEEDKDYELFSSHFPKCKTKLTLECMVDHLATR